MHTEVEKRDMLQWQLKITDYADRLIEDLEELDWPEEIKDSQRNWIGRSEGTEISFQIVDDSDQRIDVFTTRPDTLFGATYMVLAPEHPLVAELSRRAENTNEVTKYIKEASRKTEIERTTEGKEKTGVELKGVRAINPANNEEVPVWVADYVLGGYGTGAIMAVPAHDERDYAFAQKFDLPIRQVIESDESELPYTGTGFLVASGNFDGLVSEDAKVKITETVSGELKTTYRLRDWVVSRQRYWGVPIPIIHCGKCGPIAVPEDQLPIELPEIKDYLPSGDGRSPLAKVDDWVQVDCPECGGSAERETDTLDTFVDSSWYFLRYTDPQNESTFADRAKQDLWMPVDVYSGGAEHITMHLLYSRFWHKALFDLGLVTEKEPYKRRMNRGIILGPDGQKMSKSRGNVINPDEAVSAYGADTVRMYLAFIGPYNEPGHYPWTPDGVRGMRRFLDRVWRLQERIEEKTASEAFERLFNQTIQKVSEDTLRMKFNTAIAQLMTFVNEAEQGIDSNSYKVFLQLLAPFAPHMAEELWHRLGNENSIHLEAWPEYDESKLSTDEVTIAVQVNGKTRAQVVVAAEAGEETVRPAAEEEVAKWLEGEVKKVIFVPGRLINFVVS